MSSYGLHFLLMISLILLLKKDCFVALTLFLKFFQLSQLLENRYVFKVLLHSLFHQLLDCFVILIYFEFAFQAQLILEARDIVVSSSLKELLKSLVLMLLIVCMSRSKKVDLTYFIFLFIFIFFSIYFSIFRTTRVRVDQSHHHISHLMA